MSCEGLATSVKVPLCAWCNIVPLTQGLGLQLNSTDRLTSHFIGVVIHCSASSNVYDSSRDVRYQSYVQWKFTGIPNPECGNGNKGQTRNPYPG
eukprot:7121999-Ditylum_brightwellii.AAC.3